ncbi:hypothetical protein BC828DRAFT_378440 [Blastocladiella britannica]|nr:hypothetical protein BC828DRAFT_378440 [Blastocladiella britannica]
MTDPVAAADIAPLALSVGVHSFGFLCSVSFAIHGLILYMQRRRKRKASSTATPPPPPAIQQQRAAQQALYWFVVAGTHAAGAVSGYADLFAFADCHSAEGFSARRLNVRDECLGTRIRAYTSLMQPLLIPMYPLLLFRLVVPVWTISNRWRHYVTVAVMAIAGVTAAAYEGIMVAQLVYWATRPTGNGVGGTRWIEFEAASYRALALAFYAWTLFLLSVGVVSQILALRVLSTLALPAKYSPVRPPGRRTLANSTSAMAMRASAAILATVVARSSGGTLPTGGMSAATMDSGSGAATTTGHTSPSVPAIVDMAAAIAVPHPPPPPPGPPHVSPPIPKRPRHINPLAARYSRTLRNLRRVASCTALAMGMIGYNLVVTESPTLYEALGWTGAHAIMAVFCYSEWLIRDLLAIRKRVLAMPTEMEPPVAVVRTGNASCSWSSDGEDQSMRDTRKDRETRIEAVTIGPAGSAGGTRADHSVM